jgi:hypothetical protein
MAFCHLLRLQHAIQNLIPKHPTPRPLAINIHRNRRQRNRHRRPSNNIKRIPHTLHRNPIVRIKRESKCKHVLDEIHNRKRFGRLLAMAVADVGDDGRGAELHAQVDEAHANDDGDGPWVLVVERFAPREEAGGGEDEVGYHDGETEFGFWRTVSREVVRA